MDQPEQSSPAWRWYRWGELSTDLLYQLLRLRSEVFVVEQACLFPDMDGLDPHCEHLCGTDANGAVVAYARLLPPGLKHPEAALGRVVTAAAVRGSGAGRELMRQALAGCQARHPRHAVRIGAQQRLERFYGELGFVTVSEPYLEDGILHVDMLLSPS